MTTCLEKTFLFDLLYTSFVKLITFSACAFSFCALEVDIVLVPDHCLSFLLCNGLYIKSFLYRYRVI